MMDGVKANGTTQQPTPIEPTPTPSPIIIFHPGSKYLRIGVSSSSSDNTNPITVLHAIGRRRKVGQGFNTLRRDGLFPNDNYGAENSRKLPPEVESARLQLCHTLQTCLKSDGSSRFITPFQTIRGYNHLAQKGEKDEQSNCSNSKQWEEFPGKEFIVGDDVLAVNPDGDYNIHFPWRRGQPNVHENIGGSLASVITDLFDIWRVCVTDKLGIRMEDLKNYRAVVVLPVMFEKRHAQAIMEMVLNTMGFLSAFLIQDHICSAFASGLGSAVVVDVGDQKVSVSCVEDGISVPQSRICLRYGGVDLTYALLHLMNQSGMPFPVDHRTIWDADFLNGVKESFCHLDLDRCGPEVHTVVWNKPGCLKTTYKTHFGDELLIVPLSYFNPDLLRGSMGAKPVSVYRRQLRFPDDPYDDIIVESMRKTKESEDGDVEDVDDNKDENVLASDSEKLLGVDQAILQSIESSDASDDTKRRLYSCVLVVGGGFKFQGFGPWLQKRLSIASKAFKDVEVLTRPKDTDPEIATWKGASIIVQLETASELWISQAEWNKLGFRVLRERSLCSF